MKFYLDITPAIVNKTAIHNIIKDTIDHTPDSASRLLNIGKSYSYSGNFGTGLPRLMRWALKAPTLFTFLRRLIVFFLPKDPRPVFFFDPLYLLFYRDLVNAKIMVLDLTPLTFPEWHDPKVGKLYKAAFQLVKKRNFDCYSISESTRLDLKNIVSVSEEKNHLLYIYANEKFFPHQEPVLSKQILFVGSFEPRKNLTGLIRAFVKSQLSEQGFTLNIVGAATAHFESVKSEITNQKGIVFHGYVSQSELHTLYKNAHVFAYPSFWEGFGVPLLEAMNMKIACFASKTGACPEVGGPAMIYVDPRNEAEIVQALKRLCFMNKSEYIDYADKNWSYAKKFSFEKYIQTLQKALQ